MSQKSFSEAVKNDAALQGDLNKAVQAAIAEVAKKHGVAFSGSDLSKTHTAPTALGCVSTAWTAVCTV
ncbi:Nif11-like leader peptide family natural product precursor [Mucilaginibacter aquariorum]|uniref:Nif11-like leader peptide family natural product n=1 Tax=Mucilaginibacter aquariorum TaxID=2967225 RepID=A0ABT1T1R3_9SPHI|nr:Nif11-like leader peptide family natural product precursor [Mucilaginibacter aquariorum]MCQ6958541.1 Nif11-like leader peptide family natural product precursor [Mucilaginibacter aquariorum]